MTQAEALFDRIIEYRIEAIRDLVKYGPSEKHFVEYKTRGFDVVGQLTKEEQMKFSKEISSFANSDGGVLIIGIRQGDKDLLPSLAPVDGISSLEASFNALANSLTDPPCQLVTQSIPECENSDRGYVAVFVPPSIGEPRQAKDKCYYVRAGESSCVASHANVKGMMLRGIRFDYTFEIDPKCTPTYEPLRIEGTQLVLRANVGFQVHILAGESDRFSFALPESVVGDNSFDERLIRDRFVDKSGASWVRFERDGRVFAGTVIRLGRINCFLRKELVRVDYSYMTQNAHTLISPILGSCLSYMRMGLDSTPSPIQVEFHRLESVEPIEFLLNQRWS